MRKFVGEFSREALLDSIETSGGLLKKMRKYGIFEARRI